MQAAAFVWQGTCPCWTAEHQWLVSLMREDAGDGKKGSSTCDAVLVYDDIYSYRIEGVLTLSNAKHT